jgi:hypothetical protein
MVCGEEKGVRGRKEVDSKHCSPVVMLQHEDIWVGQAREALGELFAALYLEAWLCGVGRGRSTARRIHQVAAKKFASAGHAKTAEPGVDRLT